MIRYYFLYFHTGEHDNTIHDNLSKSGLSKKTKEFIRDLRKQGNNPASIIGKLEQIKKDNASDNIQTPKVHKQQ